MEKKKLTQKDWVKEVMIIQIKTMRNGRNLDTDLIKWKKMGESMRTITRDFKDIQIYAISSFIFF